MDAIILRYRRGNHTDEHVLAHGEKIFEGNLTGAVRELAIMRKTIRDKWRESSTQDSQRDFVAYEMGEYWAFKNVGGQWVRF